jgi:hypothetical protein
MGGDLTVRSEPGVGSTFTIWLPATTPAESAAERSARADRRTPSYRPQGLGEVGELLRDEMDAVITAYTSRLRGDPVTAPLARDMRRPELEDHAPS